MIFPHKKWPRRTWSAITSFVSQIAMCLQLCFSCTVCHFLSTVKISCAKSLMRKQSVIQTWRLTGGHIWTCFKEFSQFELCIFTTIDPISNKGKSFLYDGGPGGGSNHSWIKTSIGKILQMVSLILPNFNSSCFYRIVSKSAVILLSSGKPFHLNVINCLYLKLLIWFFLYLKKFWHCGQ